MTRLEALQSCADKPIYGPAREVASNLFAYLEGSVSLSEVIYVFNMLSSANLAWIDCIKGV